MHGSFNLAPQTLEIAVEVYRRDVPESPALVLDVAGAMRDPAVRVVRVSPDAGAAPAPAPTVPDSAAPELPAPAPQEELSPAAEQQAPGTLEPEAGQFGEPAPEEMFAFPDADTEQMAPEHPLPEPSEDEPQPDAGPAQPETETAPLITD
jgi:hypothetical protein